MRKTLLFSTALFFSVTAFGAIDALNFSSSQQENDYHSLTQELRCPQCQNNNIADSNATIAVDMRGKVFELLQEGKSREEVVKYMVDRYGNFVTYDPPIILILFGVLFVFRRKQSQTLSVATKCETATTTALNEEEQQRLNELLNKENNK